MATELAERVKEIIVEHLSIDKDKVTENASFGDDLNTDSLDIVELIMKFEDEFGCVIPDEDAEKLRTVKDAIAYIESHRK